MKKYIVLLIALFGLFAFSNVKASKVDLPEVTNHEKVKVYLFRGEGCSHCYDFLTYFVNNYKDYSDYFEIVAYESWKDADNQKLMLALKKQVKTDEDTSVPFIVVGDDYYTLGFSDTIGEEIISEALKAYEDDEYTDLVAKTIKDNKISANSETLQEAASSEGIKVADDESEDKKISDGVIVAIVFGVIILSFGGLVLISRK